jgi:hypothetical protein
VTSIQDFRSCHWYAELLKFQVKFQSAFHNREHGLATPRNQPSGSGKIRGKQLQQADTYPQRIKVFRVLESAKEKAGNAPAEHNSSGSPHSSALT